MKLLVDSSVWIPFLRGHEALPQAVQDAMSRGDSRICPVIWLEIYRGIRGKREEKIARELLKLSASLPFDEACWSQANELSRKALRSGLNCPLADVLIVACAQRHGAELMHADKHMEALLAL
ncbi:MAG: PIN domain-containing protein [Verrucomicrobiales bacterium]